MAPLSPTHAFDPTPALDHNQDNFSPLSHSSANDPFSNHHSFRTVHFSDPPSHLAARHSIATTHVPLLPSVPSASQIPKQVFRITDPPPGIDIDAYIENCRNLNEQLRQAHETERKAWDIERISLKSRIAELEFQLNKSRDSNRRSSNDASATSIQSFRSDFQAQFNPSPVNGTRHSSESVLNTGPPVWRGPESTPPVTRVFSHDDDVNHLPSISEDEPFPNLSKEISPTNREDSVSIPIEQVEPTLDGITLKSTGPALTSSFNAKISSPQFSASPARSPSPRPPRNTLSTGTGPLIVDIGKLLDPLDEKLKRHAGHTPMAFDGAISTSATATTIPTPKEDRPPEPAPSVRPELRPSENSDSYFSNAGASKAEEVAEEKVVEDSEPHLQAQDDLALTGPLMLDHNAKSQSSHNFLDQVDAKLMQAAAESSRERSETLQTDDSVGVPSVPPATGAGTNGTKTAEAGTRSEGEVVGDDAPAADGETSGEGKQTVDDDMPRLKMKKSTNFGSAWGHNPGA